MTTAIGIGRYRLLLTALGVACCIPAASSADLAVIEFPSAWTRSGAVLNAPAQYELRADADAMGGLLFRVESPGHQMSTEVFSVRKENGRYRIRPAGDNQWSRATPIGKTQRWVTPSATQQITYRGREFAHSGQTADRALLSPNERWLAVPSYTGRGKIAPPVPFLTGGGPSKGDVFLDIYEVSSERRLLGAKAAFSQSGQVMIDSAFWAGNRYFVMPLNLLLRKTFLAVLDDK